MFKHWPHEYWTDKPDVPQEALAAPERPKERSGAGAASLGVGATSGTERLTLTVEGAQLLGASPAFAYEAVRAGKSRPSRSGAACSCRRLRSASLSA